jgi:hypothetical protein
MKAIQTFERARTSLPTTRCCIRGALYLQQHRPEKTEILQNFSVLHKNTLQAEGKREKEEQEDSGEEQEPDEGGRGRRSRITKIKRRREGGEKRKYKYKKMNIVFVNIIILFKKQSVHRSLMMPNFKILKINKTRMVLGTISRMF